MTDLGDRLAGAVWGHLVGDAVGVPYEFGPAVDPRDVRFGAKGAHGQPPGTWSDDGALMLVTAATRLLARAASITTDQAHTGTHLVSATASTRQAELAFSTFGRTRPARHLEAFESGLVG